MTVRTLPLTDGIYHIYNRAVGNEPLFKEEQHYKSFLTRLEKYVLPHIHLWSYCLMPNHFHLLAEIKEENMGEIVSKKLGDCCNSYVKWFNTLTDRKGSLFMRPFKRDKIINDAHLAWIIWYIHQNPIHHNYVRTLEEWKFSSYKAIFASNTRVAAQKVLDFFGGIDSYVSFHSIQQNCYFESFEK